MGFAKVGVVADKKVVAAPFGKVAAAPFGKFGSFPFAAGFGKAVAPVDFKKFGTLPVGKVAPVGKVVAVEKAVVAAPVAAKKVVGAGFDVFPAGPFLGAKSVVPGKKVVALFWIIWHLVT